MKILCRRCKLYAETTEALIRHKKGVCKGCSNQIKREFLAKRQAIDPTYGRGKYPGQKDQVSKERAKRRREDPEFREGEIAANHKARLKRIGCTVERYDRMVGLQQNLCAICGLAETRAKLNRVCKLAVDHDHETGKIRELLCYRHNIALGAFCTPQIIRRAIEYLHKYA